MKGYLTIGGVTICRDCGRRITRRSWQVRSEHADWHALAKAVRERETR